MMVLLVFFVNPEKANGKIKRNMYGIAANWDFLAT